MICSLLLSWTCQGDLDVKMLGWTVPWSCFWNVVWRSSFGFHRKYACGGEGGALLACVDDVNLGLLALWEASAWRQSREQDSSQHPTHRCSTSSARISTIHIFFKKIHVCFISSKITIITLRYIYVCVCVCVIIYAFIWVIISAVNRLKNVIALITVMDCD